MTALVWCPFPDQGAAQSVANTLLEEELVACANIVPGMHSLFVWKGERGESQEVGVLFKTNSSLLESVVSRIESLHPYDAPAIFGWHCEAAGTSTRAWLGELSEHNESD